MTLCVINFSEAEIQVIAQENLITGKVQTHFMLERWQEKGES